MAPVAVGSEGPHGQKRPAPDELEGEQRLTKRLGRLHIGQNGTSTYSATPPSNAIAEKGGGTRIDDDDDTMNVDDTKTRVFIRDLDSEIAELETQEQEEKAKIQFLPDIEKKLNDIPRRVLHDDHESSANANQQLVLYRLPSSLSIPEDKDSVRRAIVEARQRAAQEAADAADTTKAPPDGGTSRYSLWNASSTNPQDHILRDEDAMDID